MLAQNGGLMTENPPPQKTITRTYQNSWGKRHSLLIILLAVILLALLCYTLSVKALHWKICKNPDHSNTLQEELFWQICKEEQEVLFLKTCEEFDRNPPPNTEVLVSACKRPGAIGVPGGKVLFVREGLTNKMYLLDLRTGEKRDAPDDPLLLDHGIFLSSELVWLEGSLVGPDNPDYRPHYILDLTDGKRYELLDLEWLPLKDGKFDPQYYTFFQSAEQVFIDHTNARLIALAPNFRQHPEENVTVHGLALIHGLSFNEERYDASRNFMEQLMKDLKINYEVVDFSLRYTDVPSPTGKYIVRHDGIYLSGTNTLVVSREWYFMGWYYDESGAVIHEGTTFLYHAPFGGGVGFPVPHPILKLRLPVP
jgi:hypothetical protein